MLTGNLNLKIANNYLDTFITLFHTENLKSHQYASSLKAQGVQISS